MTEDDLTADEVEDAILLQLDQIHSAVEDVDLRLRLIEKEFDDGPEGSSPIHEMNKSLESDIMEVLAALYDAYGTADALAENFAKVRDFRESEYEDFQTYIDEKVKDTPDNDEELNDQEKELVEMARDSESVPADEAREDLGLD